MIGVSWINGRPETARVSHSWFHCQWVKFVLGISTFWPDPRKAERVCSVWGYMPEQIEQLTPRKIADICQQQIDELIGPV